MKIDKTRFKDRGLVRHQTILKRYPEAKESESKEKYLENKSLDLKRAEKEAWEIAKELGYTKVRFIGEHTTMWEFMLFELSI